MNNYVMTHCHTVYSIGDSTTQPDDLINRAKECGMKAICITEHGNNFNWIKKKQLCDKAGIKYIHGIEIYLTRTLKEKIKDNYHTILIAKNYKGVLEINKLMSIMYDEQHFYYRPRLSFEEFINLSDNIITTSACLGSPLRALSEEDEWFYPLMERYDYLEIQPHVVKKQIDYNNKLSHYAFKYGKPLISGTDTHEIDEYHKECRMMYMIGRAKSNGEEYYDDAKDFDLSFKTFDEVCEMYEKTGLDRQIWLTALENTNILSDICDDFQLDTSYKYPDIYEDPLNDIKKVCYDRLNELLNLGAIDGDRYDEYIDRIESETEIFDKLGMCSFMYYQYEQSKQCWDNDIIIGCGRGSVTGSVVAYLLQITDVDAIKWRTNFVRFCNPNRISLGDIDKDHVPGQRKYVFYEMTKKFGEENTAYIITFQKMKIKTIIDYICRALDKPRDEMISIKKGYEVIDKQLEALETQFNAERIQEDEYHEKKAILEKEMEEYLARYDDIFYYYKGINGAIKSYGFHPAGYVCSPINIRETIGYIPNKTNGGWIVQCDMKCVDSLNYVKYDVLSLKTLAVLNEAFTLAGKKFPKSYEIDWNDQAVFEDMIKSEVALFQFEAINSFNNLKKFQPKSVEDIAFVTAVIRPSCASFANEAIGKIEHKNPDSKIDELLKNSYGYLIYQEQIISFLQKICGFTEGDSDVIRRLISKKDKKLLDEWLPKIEKGYIENSSKPYDEAKKDFHEFAVTLVNGSNYGL